MARLKSCRVCKNPVSTSAKACPLCGAKNPSTTVGEQFGGLVVLAVIAAVVWFACFNDTGDEQAAGPATTTTTTTTTVGPSNTTTQAETTPATTAMSNADGFATPTTPTLATVATTAPAVTTTAIPANPGDIVSCADFATWEEAQDWFDTYAPHYGDVAFMDGNDNGVACEKLLPEGVTVAEVLASQQTTTTTTTTTTRLTTTTTRRPTTTTTSTGEAEALFIWQIAVDATQGLLDLTNDEAVTFGYAACADLRRESVADVFLLYGLLFGETDGGILIRHATTWLCPELRDYVSREVDRLLGY